MMLIRSQSISYFNVERIRAVKR